MSTSMLTSDLREYLSKNVGFHALVENEVNRTPYGQITFTTQLVDGQVVMTPDTINIVRIVRRRYNKEVDTT